MRIISRRKLREFWKEHVEAEKPLGDWYRLVKRARWTKFAEIRATFASADQVLQFVVFNIGGNKFRLIAFQGGKVFIRHILTHKDYDKDDWKKDDFGRSAKKRKDGERKRRGK